MNARLYRNLVGLAAALFLAGCCGAPTKESKAETTEQLEAQLVDLRDMLVLVGNSLTEVKDTGVGCACGGAVRPLGPGPRGPATLGQQQREAIERAQQALNAWAEAEAAQKPFVVTPAAVAVATPER